MKRYLVEWPALGGIWPTLLDWLHSCTCVQTACMAAEMIASCCCCSMSVTCCASCVDWRFSNYNSPQVIAVFAFNKATQLHFLAFHTFNYASPDAVRAFF